MEERRGTGGKREGVALEGDVDAVAAHEAELEEKPPGLGEDPAPERESSHSMFVFS